MTTKTTSGFGFKAAVLSIIALVYASSGATPALGAISQAFQNVSPEVIKQIATIPSLMTVVFAILGGYIAKYFTRRQMVFATVVILVIGGCAPAFGGGINFILACRVVFGAGTGLAFMLYSTLIGDFFKGVEQQVMFGYAGSLGGICGVIYQMAGGFLASIDWRYSFLTSAFVIIPMILIYFKMPNPAPKQPDPSEEAANIEVVAAKVTGKTYGLAIANAFYQMFQFSFMTNMAIVIAGTNMGSPALAGTVLTLFSAGAFVAGLIYTFTHKIFGKFTLPFAIACTLIAFILLNVTNTISAFCVAGFIFGLGFGTYNPNYNYRILSSAGKGATSKVSGIFWGLNGLGQFFSPLVLFPLVAAMSIPGGPKAPWLVVCGGLAVFFVVWTIICAMSKSEKKVSAAAK